MLSVWGSLLGIGLLAAGAAQAATLSLSPASIGPVTPGTTLVFDLILSGVGDDANNTVGAYDFDLSYDPAVVSFAGFTYHPFLGVLEDDEVIVASGAAGGTIDIAAVSLLDEASLVALQPASFAVGTITLVAVGPGAFALAFTQSIVSDVNALDIALTQVDGASVQVVPEPGTAWLLAGGLAWLGARRRAR
jgi:hypothetical protein